MVVHQRNSTYGLLDQGMIHFRIEEGEIVVSARSPRNQEDRFTAKPHLSMAGECMFEVDGTPLRPWQVSRLALESLFFGS